VGFVKTLSGVYGQDYKARQALATRHPTRNRPVTRTLALLMTALAAPATAAEPPKVEIVGHRGASFDAPENTVASVKLAWEQKADAAEFDVLLSKDGNIVVIHDANTKRVAGVDRPVVSQTLEELRELDVGKWKNAKFAGEKIPTLEEVLATVPAGKRVFIEVKCGPEIVPELDRVLKASKLKPEQTAVISFSAEVIAAVKKARPALQGYWVVNLAPKNQKPRNAEELIAKAREIKADGLDLSATPAILDKAFGAKVKAAGLNLYVWTVNDPQLAKQMIDAGVESLTTDRPGWLREQIAK
jgi:glycerophosphoryl diester phosphodiesterase